MTKMPQRSRPAHHPTPLRSIELREWDILAAKGIPLIVAVVVLAGVPFALGKYFEFNSPDAFDSGAYVHSASHILHGAKMGVEEQVSARMGTLLVNMVGVALFGFNETGPKLIQMFLQAAALTLMFVTVRRVYGGLAAVVSTVVASFYLSAPVIAKFGNVKEQYMIAFMVIGICCFIWSRLTGRWWLILLSGATLAWGPLFKQTGLSAIGATGLFVIGGAMCRQIPWRQAGREVALLIAGGLASVGPVWLWLAIEHAPASYYPYYKIVQVLIPVGGERIPAYVAKGRQMVPMSEVAPRIFRYYRILILPVILAIGAIILAGVQMLRRLAHKGPKQEAVSDRPEYFVGLLATWWLLDMAFIWISPRSYEQYYLPLNASAAMLGGYLVGRFMAKARAATSKGPWVAIGTLAVIAMIGLAWPVAFGIAKSPHSGVVYVDRRTGQPSPDRGYLQRWREITSHPVYEWQRVADTMRENTETDDRLFVWGWYPGIYVRAQRMSASSYAFTSEMHVRSPESLKEMIDTILADFEKHPPKFIVDSRKVHFPWNRPQLELWPLVPMQDGRRQFLPDDDAAVAQFEAAWRGMLARQFGEEEAQRFDVMKPLRDYVRRYYGPPQMFGTHVLFSRNPNKVDRELQP